MLTADHDVAAAVRNRAAKALRDADRRVRRLLHGVGMAAKRARLSLRRHGVSARDRTRVAYSGSVKASRAIDRWRHQAWERAATEMVVRRSLRRTARGDRPIIVGPWLGEVGYEALYWVPFVRWFVDQYRVDPQRVVVVSRGGVHSWYAGISHRYVELFDLVSPAELGQAVAHRQSAGDQKQYAMSDFDRRIIDDVRRRIGSDATVCHPSSMFRLLRRFWLGGESVQYLLDHTSYRLLGGSGAGIEVPLPPSFVAVKFYSGRAMPEGRETRSALRQLLERTRRGRPIVVLDTGLAADEHHDYARLDLPDVVTLGSSLTPQNNLGLQTEVIRRAELFVGTCGSLAWLAPMLGTETIAVYADDHLLSPHLYAARQVYPAIGAAAFMPVDLRTLALVNDWDTVGG